MKDIVNKIIELYNSPDGGVGGYGHIVFDDDNIETGHVEWCIEEAEKGEYEFIGEETRQKSIVALEAILPLSEEERQGVINESFNVRYSR
tara:strand:+ start:496 stop:765 length:270 start_codon:yes stop_codon:yes gene_type:complete